MSYSKKYFLIADIDAFFASVEENRRNLHGKPLAVGGPSLRRGVVSSANYIARKYGVKAAMPIEEALKLCPEMIVVKPDFETYVKYSRAFSKIVERFFPRQIKLSIDEVLIPQNITKYFPLEELPELIYSMKKTVEGELGLNVTVGGGPNPELAKMATNISKPDGLKLLPVEEKKLIKEIEGIPIREFPGIGRKSALILEGAGMKIIKDLLSNRDTLALLLGGKRASELIASLRGVNTFSSWSAKPQKSIGREITFAKNISPLDKDSLEAALFQVCFLVATKAAAEEVKGKTVALKVKFSDFTVKTWVETLPIPAYSPIFLKNLLMKHLVKLRKPIRLIGIYLKDLVPITLEEEFLPGFDKTLKAFRKEEKFLRKIPKNSAMLKPAMETKLGKIGQGDRNSKK